MAVYGYARVSTREQDFGSQVADLRAAGCEKIYSEKASGARGDRAELAKVVKRLQAGDVLVVTRLGPRGVCHVGYVDALANRDANEIARRIADEKARAFRCDADKPVIVGATGPGFSSTSQAERIER